ncbi:enoyl-CoA hydratase/carnithine racemase [Panacagrimonas perspica]|uniref:Enoyl-CoA hydratase/carnithine racemase n=1 Tax=Panacagrimonas perspica TaxID=381431 RepID=A0A4S3K2Q9_9GAMM|nr:enoyl-CoA hydratase/isomerase family protein [Panacagrimonas perspica]TDU28895.1 enoyl-CoA hydratase/carnithine racemase [Panacagrimonas perspica]THD02279.1 enoyl-CoA hydratase [Panacagrimonas perspica]
MTTKPAVERTQHGRVSVLSMVHGPHNLLEPVLLDGILKGLEESKAAGATAIVLRSGLKHFSAGARIDLIERAANDGSAFAMDVVGFLKKFEAFPLPVIASVNGACVGGGFELASACDYIVAGQTARIGSVEVGIGLHPLMGAIQRAADRAGALRAKEMSLLGRRYEPEVLERWGLINLVVPDAQLESVTMTIATEIASGPTVAHTATKKLAQIAANSGVSAADEAMEAIQKPIWASEDLKVGLAAYRAAGAPGTASFKGR